MIQLRLCRSFLAVRLTTVPVGTTLKNLMSRHEYQWRIRPVHERAYSGRFSGKTTLLSSAAVLARSTTGPECNCSARLTRILREALAPPCKILAAAQLCLQ